MAKLDGPLYGEEATGRVAGVLYYRRTQPYPEIYSRPRARGPATPNQIAARERYREAVQAWGSLSQSARDQYNDCCLNQNTGFNLFLRLHLRVFHSVLNAVVFGEGVFDEDVNFGIPDHDFFIARFPDAVDAAPVIRCLYDNLSAFAYNFLGSRLVAVEQYLIDHKNSIEG